MQIEQTSVSIPRAVKLWSSLHDETEESHIEGESGVTLVALAPAPKKKLLYEYDFGDSWLHEILVEKILPPDPGMRNPVCAAGENACPPEDCGGIFGYYDLLAAIADPKHPDHGDLIEWLDEDFDPAEFSVDSVNRDPKARIHC